MLTYAEAPVLERDDRPAYRTYSATVSRILELSPSFRRVTFTAPDFATFGDDRLDQRIKLMFPLPGLGLSDISHSPDWYSVWRELPDERRNPFRTYTVRAIDRAAAELEVDFFVHEDGGPASRWLASAAEGDELVIVGPDGRSIHSAAGIDWQPGDATRLLLAGDETATPAICSILESLPSHVTAHAFIQVPTMADAQPVTSAADITVTWLTREAGAVEVEAAVRAWTAEHPRAYGSALSASRQELADIDVDTELLWDSPQASPGDFYAWLAGESALIKSLRRFLVTETGIDRKRVAFMGYWRLGKAEAQE